MQATTHVEAMTIDLIAEYLQRSSVDLTGFSGTQADAVSTSITKALWQRFELNSEDTLRKRHKNFGIPGTVPSDFTERLLDFGKNQCAVAGIRHFNGNIEKPFVDVSAMGLVN